eukprot:PhF_6_TR29399/c0_g1_i1/m.43390
MSRTFISERARFETELIQRQTTASLTWKDKYSETLPRLKHTPVLCRQPGSPTRAHQGTKSPPRPPRMAANNASTSNLYQSLPPRTATSTQVTIAPSRRHFNLSDPETRRRYYSQHVGRPTTSGQHF